VKTCWRSRPSLPSASSRSSGSHLPIHACSPWRDSRFTPARRGGIHPSVLSPSRRLLRAGGRPLSSLRAVGSTEPEAAFTLIELLVVVGFMGILMVLLTPAFTNIKSGGDVTSAAYTIKGVLDTARTYAKANNTYVWVGFFEEDVSQPSTNPATAGTGRIVMSIVASKDGTTLYDPSSPATIDPTKLIQVGKLTKIENEHLAGDALFTTTPSTPTGSTFNNRPPVTSRIASPPNSSPSTNSSTPFQYPVGSPAPSAQYTFVKAVQFSPGGEARIDNSADYTLQTAAEIGLRATHGTTVDIVSPNVVAIQFTGVGGSAAIYRK
jgi:type II secretory pathway pseudopilin PulG